MAQQPQERSNIRIKATEHIVDMAFAYRKHVRTNSPTEKFNTQGDKLLRFSFFIQHVLQCNCNLIFFITTQEF